MNTRRLNVSPRMQALMTYRKMAGPSPRVLILESQYWVDAACMRAAKALGWKLERVPTRMQGSLPKELIVRLIETLAAFRPDFVLTINLSGMDEEGLFAGLFEDLRIPYVTWFVDDPRTILMSRGCYGSPYALALSWERAYTEYLSRSGFAEVHYLPLAADHLLFNAAPKPAPAHPPAFVGHSMTDFAAQEQAWIDARPALAGLLRAAFENGRVTRERFGHGLGALLGEEAIAGLDPHEQRHAEMLCFIEGTRRLRADLLLALEGEEIHVRGDAPWKEIVRHWGPFVDYEGELPAFYNDCEVNLNITSIQMPSAVNQRVFDCPAASGFLLTDAQGDLESLFDAKCECARYDGAEDARDKLRFYRANPAARREIIQRARQRILSEHTYLHRLRAIAAIVRARFG